jgi:predicted nucleic acid-binding protein
LTSAPFIDANIFIRHLTGDNVEQSPRSTNLISRLEEGILRVQVPEFVVFETIFTLDRFYRWPKESIRDGVMAILNFPSISVANIRLIRRALDVYVEYNISFGDAYYVTLMEQRGVTEIVSFDRDFDRVPGITRIEP